MPVKNIFTQESVFSVYPSDVIITKCGISLNGTRTAYMGFTCICLGFFRVTGFAKTELKKQDVRHNIKLLPTNMFVQPPYCN